MIYQEKAWHETALKLRESGLSSRKIGSALGLGKTTINDFFVKYNKATGLGKKSKEKEELVYCYWDLETSFMQGYFFDIWQVNIPMTQVTKQSHLLSASWAFNDGEPEGVRLTPEQVKTGDDLEVVTKLLKAISKADVIVTFNGKKFDVKKLNTRALYWGLPPCVMPRHIDLMQDAKRLFKFPSNSMQNISQYLGEGGKIATNGTRLWQRCAEYWDYEICSDALQEMLDYNLQDIVATRDLHKRFLGWSKNTPNIGNIVKDLNNKAEGLNCVHCGSEDVFKIDQKAYTAVSSFDLYRCGNTSCRGVSRVTAKGNNLVNYI